MGTRYYIYVGDTTTAGGIVLSGVSTTTWHNRVMAYEDDTIQCKACKSVGIIKLDGTRLPFKGPNGKAAALSGDLCICGCHPPPRLVASQTNHWTEGESIGGGSSQSQSTGYDRQIQMTDNLTGVPLANQPYQFEHNGQVIAGQTDEHGMTQPLHTGDSAAKITVHIIGIEVKGESNV